jgi:deoxyribodipyrimidine photo-lyase
LHSPFLFDQIGSFILAMALAVGSKATRGSTCALWLRCDLRLDDHPALHAACDGSKSLLPVFAFDPAKFRKQTLAGSWKSSARRARFLLESVACLRQRLESKGSGLAVALGASSEVVPKLCSGSDCTEVFVSKGYCSEETNEEASVARELKRAKAKTELKRHWGGMLYMPGECGCPADNAPLMFTSFKNKAESRGQIRNPLDAPAKLPPLPTPTADDSKSELTKALQFLPTLEELGYSKEEAEDAMRDDPRSVLKFEGGETAALDRLQRWMFDDDKLKDYFEIRNGMKGEGYSSKQSPWLALGCISPRRIWKEAQRYEKERVKNKSTYWLVFELTWRDFFIYMGLSQGDKLFKQGGVTGEKQRWHGGMAELQRWKEGRTGDQLVDANMRELAATGFMSNRGRQNVASYLIMDLSVDWRYGAAHFEEHLLDYDPCSNWGNWIAAAGLTGQRINKFNTKKQLNDYDPKREYVNHWLKGGGLASAPGATPTRTHSTEDKINMSLDELASSPPKSGKGSSKGSGYSGKGGRKGGGSDNPDNDIKRRRWQARNERNVQEAY